MDTSLNATIVLRLRGAGIMLLAAFALCGCGTTREWPAVAVVITPHAPPRLMTNRPSAPPPAMIPERRVEIAPPPALEVQGLSFSNTLAGQILLDRKNFSCGAADGTLDENTLCALRAWQMQAGLPATRGFDDETLRRLGGGDRAFTNYSVTPEDHKALTRNPSGWLAKSQVNRLGYESILEAQAELGHLSQSALERLNPDAPWPDPPPGTALVVPRTGPSKYVEAARLRISLGKKIVRVYSDRGALIAQFPCSIARDKDKQPVGILRISTCADNPTYTFDPAVFAEDPDAQQIGKRLLIPAGPNNPVGVAWIGLDLPGYGLHGTPHPEDIGKTESHGCFRLANWNARKLIRMIKIGTPVVVEP